MLTLRIFLPQTVAFDPTAALRWIENYNTFHDGME